MRMGFDVISMHEVERNIPPAQVACPPLTLPRPARFAPREGASRVEVWKAPLHQIENLEVGRYGGAVGRDSRKGWKGEARRSPLKRGLIGFRATDAKHAALVRVAERRNATLTSLVRHRLEPLLAEGRPRTAAVVVGAGTVAPPGESSLPGADACDMIGARDAMSARRIEARVEHLDDGFLALSIKPANQRLLARDRLEDLVRGAHGVAADGCETNRVTARAGGSAVTLSGTCGADRCCLRSSCPFSSPARWPSPCRSDCSRCAP